VKLWWSREASVRFCSRAFSWFQNVPKNIKNKNFIQFYCRDLSRVLMVLSSFCGIASCCKLVKSDQHETHIWIIWDPGLCRTVTVSKSRLKPQPVFKRQGSGIVDRTGWTGTGQDFRRTLALPRELQGSIGVTQVARGAHNAHNALRRSRMSSAGSDNDSDKGGSASRARRRHMATQTDTKLLLPSKIF